MINELAPAESPTARKFAIFHWEPVPVTTTTLLLLPAPSPTRPVALLITPPAEIVTRLFLAAFPTNISLLTVHWEPGPVTVTVLLLLEAPLRLRYNVPLFAIWPPLLTTTLTNPFQPTSNEPPPAFSSVLERSEEHTSE